MSLRRRFEHLRRIFRRRYCLLLSFVALFLFICYFGVHNLNSETYVKISDNDIAAIDKSALFLVAKTVFKKGVLGNYEPTEKVPRRKGLGENGKPVYTDDKEKSRRADSEFGFDTYVSDKISLERSIPDTRPSECKYWHYPYVLPKTTVVVVFHNEAWTPLLRTVHSVLNKTPAKLLTEVLMVDDFSDKKHLKSELEGYIKQFNGRVRLMRNKQREGLIRSRSIGAENAKGDVVVFLDAHCECNVNWLPPLLAPIAEDDHTVTVPVIDSIDMNTWQYHPQYGGRGTELFRGIFEWGLLYKEAEIPSKEKATRRYSSEPFRSPTHAGGLFAISRRWFKKLGYYDPGLQIWGGENFELSFKVWQCGGRVLNVPCSRVGHVYRNHMPYRFGNLSGPVISTNYKRVVEVWMDSYKENYYNREPFMRYRDAGDLTQQKLLRENNKCKNFSWFMEHVAYDVPNLYPLQPENIVWGEVKNEANGLCMDTMGQPIPGVLGVSGCHGYGGNQLYRLNAKGQLTTGEWCVVAVSNRLQTSRCEFGSVEGAWKYDKDTKQVHNSDRDKCLNSNSDVLNLENCDPKNPNQKWIWKELRI